MLLLTNEIWAVFASLLRLSKIKLSKINIQLLMMKNSLNELLIDRHFIIHLHCIIPTYSVVDLCKNKKFPQVFKFFPSLSLYRYKRNEELLLEFSVETSRMSAQSQRVMILYCYREDVVKRVQAIQAVSQDLLLFLPQSYPSSSSSSSSKYISLSVYSFICIHWEFFENKFSSLSLSLATLACNLRRFQSR